MRLVCPNCEAKYEVPDDAIPDTGRDVQCTNCGHTWFQMRGRIGAIVAPAPAEPAAVAAQAVEAPVSAPEDELPSEPTPEPTPDLVPEPVAAIEVASVEPTAPLDAVEAVEPVPDRAEEAVGDIAAESGPAVAAQSAELAHDDAAAVADTPPLEADGDIAPSPDTLEASAPETADAGVAVAEVQAASDPVPEPDLGPDTAAETPDTQRDADVAPEPAAEAVAESPAAAPVATYAVDESVLAILREEAEREANARRAEALESQTDLGLDAAMPRKAAFAEAEPKPAARRDLLPDVEEINSTLRPSEIQAAADGTPDFVAPPPEAPRGFRSGFLTLMTIAILAAALYLAAPRIAVLVPGLSGPLGAYVSMIDSMRLGLDGMMRSATVAISDG